MKVLPLIDDAVSVRGIAVEFSEPFSSFFYLQKADKMAGLINKRRERESRVALMSTEV